MLCVQNSVQNGHILRSSVNSVGYWAELRHELTVANSSVKKKFWDELAEGGKKRNEEIVILR